jgi:hypothetical protein
MHVAEELSGQTVLGEAISTVCLPQVSEGIIVG